MRRIRTGIVLAACATLLGATDASAIVNGRVSDEDRPWMVYYNYGPAAADHPTEVTHWCGGAMVAPTWVLTSTHCLRLLGEDTEDAATPAITSVVVGRRDKRDVLSGERIGVKRHIADHEGFYDKTFGDSALIELERAPAGPTEFLKIAGPFEEALWRPGTAALTMGWGYVKGGDLVMSSVLRELDMRIISDDECRPSYEGKIWGWVPAHMVCAVSQVPGGSTCSGDSGGPLLVKTPDGAFRIVGTVSFGDGCDDEFPDVFSESAGAGMRAWFMEHLPEAVSRGTLPSASFATPVVAPAPAPASAAPPRPAAPLATAAKPSRAAARRRCRTKARRIKSARKRRQALRACSRR